MKSIHILVAEDDVNIRTGLVDTLESEGYRVSAAANGEAATALIKENAYHLILLDIMMPGKSGYDVCREIRSKNQDVPIIMLTAKGEEIDKVVGLQLGADDYITKPFGVHELLARISAVLRRSLRNQIQPDTHGNGMAPFAFGDAKVDTKTFELRKGEQTTALGEREIKLLRIFAAHPNEVLSRDFLLNEAWGIDYYGTTRTLDQHIANLRKKIEKDPSSPVFIKTVHGVGYRYIPA